MRRRLLVCLAVYAALGALAPEPAPARSLLGLLFGARVHRGHHHHYAYHHHHFHPHYARHWGASRSRYARRSPAPAVVAGGVGAAAAPAITAPATPPPPSVYWPGAYQDLAGFTFASGGTDNAFWSHGFRDVFAGVIVPPGATGGADAQGCAATNADAADAAFKQIEDRLALTPEQRPPFDDLHDAMGRALARIDATCGPGFATAAPPERMKAISDRLWALRQAMLTLRTPVEKAYNALNEQQRARLDTPSSKVACTADAVQFAWPRDQIEQVLEPNDQQRAALEMLRQISLQMAQAVASSCPRQALTTPLQRLDAAGDRLNTMLYAAMIVGRALGNVYASLSDQQKANFNTLGRTLGKNPRAAAVETGAR
jgi:LTXXQ motif family protein